MRSPELKGWLNKAGFDQIAALNPSFNLGSAVACEAQSDAFNDSGSKNKTASSWSSSFKASAKVEPAASVICLSKTYRGVGEKQKEIFSNEHICGG